MRNPATRATSSTGSSATIDDVEGLKDLAVWLRSEGFQPGYIKVGAVEVQIVADTKAVRGVIDRAENATPETLVDQLGGPYAAKLREHERAMAQSGGGGAPSMDPDGDDPDGNDED